MVSLVKEQDILPYWAFHWTTNRSILGLAVEIDQAILAVLDVTPRIVRFCGEFGGSESSLRQSTKPQGWVIVRLPLRDIYSVGEFHQILTVQTLLE